MSIAIHAENAAINQGDGMYPTDIGWLTPLDLDVNQSIEVDYVRVSMEEEYNEEYSDRVNDLLVNFSSLIETVDDWGLNSTAMRTDLARFKGEWNDTGYLHAERYMFLLSICDVQVELGDISGMFEEASEAIASLREREDNWVKILEQYYGMAERAWLEYDFARVKVLLKMIIKRK
jgi:hypothetical protein